MRLNAIQPGALARQLAAEDAHSLLSFCFSVVCPNPALYRLGEVPRGIIPDHQQSGLPFFCQPLQPPAEKLDRQTRYGSTTNKPQPQLFAISSQQSITANCFGVWVCLLSRVLSEPQRFCLSPTVYRRLSKPTPPDFVSIPQHPPRVRCGQSDQPVPRLVLRAYAGSGLVIQSRALPPDPQASYCVADRLIRNERFRQPTLLADLCDQGQSPSGAGFADLPRRMVQQGTDLLAFSLIKFWFGSLRARGFLFKASQAFSGKGANDIADRLVRTAEVARNLARGFPFRTQEKKRASAQCERAG